MSDSHARVLAQHRGLWLIEGPRLVPARGRLALTPVTGDYVEVDAGGAIARVLPRAGTVVRRAAGRAAREQVLAANVDLALVVEPLPEPRVRRAERLVALARAGGVPAALVLTKADLAPGGDGGDPAAGGDRGGDPAAGGDRGGDPAAGGDRGGDPAAGGDPGGDPAAGGDPGGDPAADDPGNIAARLRRRLGLADAVAVSATTGDGLGVLRTLLPPGITAVLLGPSGAGKSTLVNALLGEQRQATAEVRASDGRGRHTTVTRELIALPHGAFLLDTPGLREAGVWDGAQFEDVDALAEGCRFADCAHESEPGCAVRAALDPARLAAWRKLRREQQWVDDRRAAARAREASGRRHELNRRQRS